MLSAEENIRLTSVGRGTPMGDLLRRYWHPVAAASDLSDGSVRPVRLMGEDLVLFRGTDNVFGLIERRCTHRGADLANGMVDGAGLRCSYHGWMFDVSGACVAQPFEDRSGSNGGFLEKSATTAYPVQEKAGLIWAYLGPAPAPLLPDWEPYSWGNGFKQIVFANVPCNWLQCQENSIDPVHFEWLHDNWGARALQGRNGPWAPAHCKLGFEEFEYGFSYRRVREGGDETGDLWQVGRVCLWPNALFIGDHFEWRVPVDDENTLSVTWIYARVPEASEPFEQESIPAWTGPVIDPADGSWITSHILNQDIVAWVGQGKIADRTRERLARSDRGITMLRRRFLADLDLIAAGQDPKAVIRDLAENLRIRLPIAERERLLRAPTPHEVRAERDYWLQRGIPDDYIYQAGQPPAVRQSYRQAMGLDDE